MLGALVLTAFLILNSSGNFNPFERKMRLKARFMTADGLHPGADVQLAGVSIGKVEEVKFLPPDEPEGQRIEATLTVGKEFQGKPITELIRSDSNAQLFATSVLGNDKIINITPGGSKGAPIEENALLHTTTDISMNQLTGTANDLLNQINKLAQPMNEILAKANRGEGTLGRVINDESLYKSLDAAVVETKGTMTRLQTTIDRINSGQGSAGKLINDPELYESLNRTMARLDAISQDLKAGRGSAGKFINDDALYNETREAVAQLKVSADKISSIADDVKSLTADMREGKGTAGKLFRDDKLYDDVRSALGKLDSASTGINDLVTDARGGKGTIGRLITDESLYNSMNQTASNVSAFTANGNQLLDDFRKNPKKYLTIHFRIF